MREVLIHGKVLKPVSPKKRYPNATLWGCTHTQLQYAKFKAVLEDWDEWFELHPIKPTPFYKGVEALRPGALKWYRKLPANSRPLWMLDHYPDIPASRRFPIEEIEKAFPPDPSEPGLYFSCQVDYLIVYAMLLGYQHIILHGHGVSQRPEHMAAHRGILYWVGFARGRGVQVTVLEPSWYRAPEKRYAYEAGGWTPKR